MKFFRKYHKWLGIILTLFILLYAFSGIVLNHRDLFSKIDVSRRILSHDYKYNNWNNAAIKGTLKLNNDSILAYGNVGIWLSDSTLKSFTNFNQGFPKGIDSKKIYKVHKTNNGRLIAGTLFGLYEHKNNSWQNLPFISKTIMDINQKGDTTLILTRSNLYKTTDFEHFEKAKLPPPPGYNNKVSLFKTLWFIHSGEILGHSGKLFTDFIGLIFIFLSVTGLIYFIAPNLIKRKKKKGENVKKIVRLNRFSLKWHNKLGWTLILFLIITTITGIFLRPPLLITIMNGKVGKIPFTELDTPNAWYDKLRRVIYDDERRQYFFATIDGIFIGNEALSGILLPARTQPPISVMGVNVFEKIAYNVFLVGSFEGLFIWDNNSGEIWDYIEGHAYAPPSRKGPPIGKHMIAGFTPHFNNQRIYFDYNTGAMPLFHSKAFTPMPNEIINQPMSLWNFALEVHTMRIFNSLIGMFYLLIIPLSGLAILFILISGFIVWYKKHRKK